MDKTIQPNRAVIYISGIVLTMALLFSISLISSPAAFHFFGTTKINSSVYLLSRSLYWVCLGLVTLYAVKVEKQKLLIWKDKKYTPLVIFISILIILGSFLIGNILMGLLAAIFKGKEESVVLNELIALFKKNIPLLILTAVTAGVTEELICRGYIQTRLQHIFKSPWIAIIVSSFLFAALHYRYGTLMNMAGPFIIGFACAVYYWKFRNIKVIIACHILWDLVALFILISHHA